MQVIKRAILSCALVVFFVGCGAVDSQHGQLKLGMVTDVGGLGDRSFNDSAFGGLRTAESKLGASILALQSRSAADYQPNLEALTIEHYDMIYAVGFLMTLDLDAVAKDHPKQHYAIIDTVVDDPNVVSITFREQEGSFLAGALAAMVSKAHHIAFIGGIDLPVIEKFESGFVAGAKQVDPSIKVDVKYAGSFDNTDTCKTIASALFDSGADIIYTAAGKAGQGAIDAVATRQADYVIGVDSDQDGLAPGKILTSMVKKVDVAVYDVGRRIASHEPVSGHVELGLKDGAVGLTNFTYTKGAIGAQNLARLNTIQQAIISGKIIPPATRRDVASFHAVNVQP
jgi:basic membrane protein A